MLLLTTKSKFVSREKNVWTEKRLNFCLGIKKCKIIIGIKNILTLKLY